MTAAAAAPWSAHLALHWSLREARSTLIGNRHSGPLRVQKALYPEGGTGHAVVLHPPGGIVDGDILDLDIRLDAGAHALHTTPGATKWYKATGPGARQMLHARVGEGAMLEWLPQENIVFDRAQTHLSNTIELDAGAGYIGWDVVCLGREASGERFEHGAIRLEGRILREGRLLWAERAAFAADDPLIDSPLGLGGARVFATVVAAGRMLGASVLDACRAIPAEAPDRCGVSAVDDVLVARWIGRSSQSARTWCERIWRTVRPGMCGRDACAPRIWST